MATVPIRHRSPGRSHRTRQHSFASCARTSAKTGPRTSPFDLTRRGFRETNAALRASEERYRELFENANDIVFTADLEGNVTSLNPAGERLSGYGRQEALSMNLETLVAPEYREVVRLARERKPARGRESTTYELEMVTKEGRRIPLEVNTRLLWQAGKPVGVQGIARDISERKQVEQALRGLNARLEEEARRIAHALHDEAGQLLASVHLAVADMACDLPPAAHHGIERVSTLLDQAAEHLRHLSHELRPIILDDFGLLPALEFLAQGVSRRSGITVSIDVAIDRRLPSLVEIALYRILQEALNNVRKHARARVVRVHLHQNARSISCSIVDDGIGFEPAPTVHQSTRAGLGLIGIRERLAALGGTLSITTGPGEGTTLAIRIPLENPPVCPAPSERDCGPAIKPAELTCRY